MSIIFDDDRQPAPVPAPQPAPAASVNVKGAIVELALLAFGAFGVWSYYVRPTPGPDVPKPSDAVAVGRAYLPELGRVYGEAWQDGAKQLDAGKAVPEAIAEVAKKWDADRTALFAARVSPAFSQVVPEAADPKSVTPEQRAALAKAWRDFAKGLGAKQP